MVTSKIESRLTQQLCRAFMLLQTEEECFHFLEDVCTISEFKALAQRLEVARMLDEGEKYEDIVTVTGASTATISRVKRCLVYGSDGYVAALQHLKDYHHEKRNARVVRKSKFEKQRAALKREVRKASAAQGEGLPDLAALAQRAAEKAKKPDGEA